MFAQIASLQGARTFFDYRQPSVNFPQNRHFRPNRQSPRGRDVFRLSPALWRFSPKWLFSLKSPVSKGPGRFSPLTPALWRLSPKSPISPKWQVSKGPRVASNSNCQRLAIFCHFRHCMHFWA